MMYHIHIHGGNKTKNRTGKEDLGQSWKGWFVPYNCWSLHTMCTLNGEREYVITGLVSSEAEKCELASSQMCNSSWSKNIDWRHIWWLGLWPGKISRWWLIGFGHLGATQWWDLTRCGLKLFPCATRWRHTGNYIMLMTTSPWDTHFLESKYRWHCKVLILPCGVYVQ